MTVISIFIIWMFAPLVELGIIVWLLAERDKHKRLLNKGKTEGRPLAQSGYAQTSYGSWPRPTEVATPQKTSLQAEQPAASPDAIQQPERTLTLQVPVPPPVQEKKKERKPRKNNLGTMALILGMVFIVLAGVIFATTTWRIMADSSKVIFIFASAVLFFGASGLAKTWFGIRKTSNAFYLLGSIFLFLSVLAAAYFQVLGTEFVLLGRNRWKVLWVGSLVLEGAFLAGIKGLKEAMYKQASLWGMSVSMLFLAKALQVGWGDFLSLMALYACVLILFVLKTGKKKTAGSVFAYLHFWIFGAASMIWSFFAIVGITSRNALGMAALFGVAAGMRSLRQKEESSAYEVMYILVMSEFCPYASMFLGKQIASVEMVSLVLLAAVALWDIWKKDRLELMLLLMSGIAPMYFYLERGTDVWWFVYTLFLALYLFRYRRDERWKKPALSGAACLFVMAFWGQSFIHWPDWIALECNLLPAVLWIWAMGEVWGKERGIGMMQRVGYMICLGILVWDAYVGGLLVDALIAEGCCLAVFVLSQIKKDIWWARISGCLMLLIVLFMTKEFWMSISWWIYLLAAGLGLILFAAVMEKKKS